MKKNEHQVIIVGGSIGGLTLAHCFQRAGIAHIVLEKANNPTSQIGASIGILPNGARILDQLGLYDQVEEQIEPLSKANVTLPGEFSFNSSYTKVLNERPVMLDILYRNYPDRNKIILGQNVTMVETFSEGVAVHTAGGLVYGGDLVVGADGVHSIVRREIWRAMKNTSPTRALDEDRTGLTIEFRCIFGISSNIPGLKLGEQVNALFDGLTIITIHGKKRTNLLKYVYPHCPRYTPTDTSTVAEKLRNVVFYKSLTFGDLWDNQETASMTVLEENIFKIWHHGRSVLLGDSVHKMTPNFGQGANMAIEDAATLTNLLREAESSANTEIANVLRQYQKVRYSRVDSVYRSSRFLVRLQARDGLINTLLTRYYIPYAGDLPADLASKTIADGVICDFLPKPKRSGDGWTKYARTQRRSWVCWLSYGLITFVLWFAFTMGLRYRGYMINLNLA
ncbi:FAD/NAD(P)-binding domain-containing protein [Penicillium hetheringtonii]|uniref:FAD/NAD(P)-binding domain-containing protein n=1 Tax=Penicillium hetheringtonii TaxID=911720 RepID=A0AAD6DB12_9EURO|nr:FAD/NAD(P)-binding domain-containing protein [Penicillium hetheringtonii]